MKNFKSLYNQVLENYTPEDSVLWNVRNYSHVNENAVDNIQTVGDVIGVIDPTPITDTVNAAVSGIRGIFDPSRRSEHFTNAAIRLAGGWLPYIGDVGKVAIHGGKVVKGAKGTLATTTKSAAKTQATKPGVVSRIKTALKSPTGKRILTGAAQLGLLSALSGDSGVGDNSQGGTNLASPTRVGSYSTEKLGTPGKFGPKLGPIKPATK